MTEPPVPDEVEGGAPHGLSLVKFRAGPERAVEAAIRRAVASERTCHWEATTARQPARKKAYYSTVFGHGVIKEARMIVAVHSDCSAFRVMGSGCAERAIDSCGMATRPGHKGARYRYFLLAFS